MPEVKVTTNNELWINDTDLTFRQNKMCLDFWRKLLTQVIINPRTVLQVKYLLRCMKTNVVNSTAFTTLLTQCERPCSLNLMYLLFIGLHCF